MLAFISPFHFLFSSFCYFLPTLLYPLLSVNFCLFPLTSAGETFVGASVNPFDATTDPPHQLDTPSADEEAQAETTAESTNIFSLEKYTNYSISVLAYTSAGDGVPSSPVYCRTLQDGQCLARRALLSRAVFLCSLCYTRE